MFTESIAPPVSPKYLHDTKESRSHRLPTGDPQLGLFAHSWMQAFGHSITEQAVALRERLSQSPSPVGWTSQRYFDARTLTRSTEMQKVIATQLAADLESFYDEFAFLRRSVTYEYGPNGIRDGYSESMSEIARNFIEKLKADNRPTERAELELTVALYVEAWMRNSNVKVGEKIVFVSPRGSKEEWYPGLDERNLVFVNIFEKTATGFELHEFRNYDPNNQLTTLQDRIAAEGHGAIQKISTLHPEYGSQDIITRVIHLPVATKNKTIEKQIFLNKKNWRMDIDKDLPHLPETEMKAKLALILEFCTENFAELSQQALPVEEKVAAFDLLVGNILKDLKKWVENAATNYDATKQKPYDFNLLRVKNVWQLELKEKRGEVLATEERKAISQFKVLTSLNTALPLHRAASFVHCMVGSPTNILNMINTAPGIPGGLMGSMTIDIQKIQSMNTRKRADLLQKLNAYHPIKIKSQTWYVPEEYLLFKECYYDERTGKIMGPCDIPLENDPEVLPEAVYLALLAELNKPENMAELDKLATSDQEKALELYNKLKKKLFLTRASFEKIMLNDVIDDQQDLPPFLQELRRQISTSLDPLLDLMHYLIDIISQHNHEMVDAITHALEEPTPHRVLSSV